MSSPSAATVERWYLRLALRVSLVAWLALVLAELGWFRVWLILPIIALAAFGVLRDAAQRVELGEVPELAGVLENLEANRRSCRSKQKLAELVEHPLPGELAQVERSAQRDELLVRRHLEAGRKLGGAQAAQGVLRIMRGIGGAKHATFQVPAPAVRIEHFAGQGIDADAVHREVATPRRFGEIERRVRLHVEAPVARAALAVAARQRKVDVDAADPQHAEGASDGMHAAEAGQQRLEPFHLETEHFDVDVLRAHAEEMVAHPAAHDEGASAGIAHGLRDLDAS